MKKQIRTTIHGEDLRAFEEFKRQTEGRICMELSDAQIAGKIIRLFLRNDFKIQSQPPHNNDNRMPPQDFPQKVDQHS
jgi:hypothetical protein